MWHGCSFFPIDIVNEQYMTNINKIVSILISVLALSMIANGQSGLKRLSGNQLDIESRQCMRCHDGSGGNKIELRPVDAPTEFDKGLFMRTKNHSIGMSYVNSYAKCPNGYIAISDLDPNIKIIDGRVGCLSCHLAKPQYLASLSVEVNLTTEECTYDSEGTEKAFQDNLCLKCHIK